MITKFRLYSKVFEAMDEVVGWTRSAVEGKSFGTFNNTIEDIILMQSTGLKDKNGVEIFEGDVVENFYIDEDGYLQKYTFTVVWEKGAFRRSDRLDETLEEELTSGFTNNHFVLGNIHEHPELMEAADGY